MRLAGVRRVIVEKYADGHRLRLEDVVSEEEPLEIRISFDRAGTGRVVRDVAVTMRTPGDDEELAMGFLVGEGLVASRSEVAGVERLAANVVRVDLATGVVPRLERTKRNFHVTSSCGLCGKVSLAAVRAIMRQMPGSMKMQVRAGVLPLLPDRLRAAQSAFAATGGIHAAGLFDREGNLICAREDVGRHNAVDKVVGAALRAGWLPAGDHILVVSGRASFELMQKAVLAGIPVLAAVGAPSSLAVRLAEESGATLLGFVRPGRFNVYAGGERIGV